MNPSITITGADERTDLERLVGLKAEIGILYSATPEGRNRYPRLEWIKEAVSLLADRGVEVAIHICGGKARAELYEWIGCEDSFIRRVRRVQINGTPSVLQMETLCRNLPTKEIITQHHAGNGILLSFPYLNHSILVDASGGRGITPDKWVRPETDKRVGFAGGIKPENLSECLAEIGKVATGQWWIDMESGVRDKSDWFSVERAEQCVALFKEHCRHGIHFGKWCQRCKDAMTADPFVYGRSPRFA